MIQRARWRGVRWLAAWLLMLPASARAADVADGSSVRVRIGFSTTLVGTELNSNDVRAALLVWAEAFSRGSHVKIEHVPEVMSTPEALFQHIRRDEVDVFSLPVSEYLQIASYTDPNLLMVDGSYVTGGEEYLIVVHADSGIRSLAELRGKNLIRFSGIVMCIAGEWLETALAQSNLGPPEAFFKQISSVPKAARAVLPVFFRQEDAGLVTRRAYDTLVEMNPQLGTKLRIIATSPKVVPVILAFHKNCTAEQRENFKAALMSLSRNPEGQQILTLFGSKGLREATPAVLASAIDIVRNSNRVRPRNTVPKENH